MWRTGRPGRCVDDCDGVAVGEKVGGEVGGGMTSRITRWREAGARRWRGGGMQRAWWTIFFCERWTHGMVVRGRAECERGDGPTCRRGRMVLPAEQRNHVQWRCPYKLFRGRDLVRLRRRLCLQLLEQEPRQRPPHVSCSC
jgi:hypothetical protein